MPEDRTRHDVLARITDNPDLARAVPLLPPDVLHEVIAHCGLQDCGDLLALATPEQLSAVFDLDLWRATRAGADEQFDAGRFCEWLEVLVEIGPAIAAARLAKMDAALVVAGLSLSREERRDRQGFLPPQQARAFLHSARHVILDADQPHELRTSGVLADTPRALLPAGRDEPPSVNAALNRYLQRRADSDAARISHDQELAFLANALVGGCSVQGRPLTRREARDAIFATCNLGLVYWPQRRLASSTHKLITVFQVGWTVLHRDVSMFAANRLIHVLDEVRCSDHDLQLGLYVLRRELHKRQQAGTPWRVRGRLDVLAALDLPAWAALQALLDECPVMLANVSASHDRRRHTLNPSEFEFIADARHIAAVHEFLLSLTELLTS